MLRRSLFSVLTLAVGLLLVGAKFPELTPKDVNEKAAEIMKAHAMYKKLTPELMQRVLNNYLEELDPIKTYFIEPDIEIWLNPTEPQLEKIIANYNNGNFEVFYTIQETFEKAIVRHQSLESKINHADLPKKVNAKDFKDIPWAKNEKELLDRLIKIRALQYEAAAKLNDDQKEKSIQRISKRRNKTEEDNLNPDKQQKQYRVLTNTLKATASSLDSHTNYFTPEEATQFMINVQQRLSGIGAQLRDDLNGLSIVKIIEGGPAYNSKELKLKDKIIAVNGEPIVGMDIEDAVELIRGKEGTPVVLTIIREVSDEKNPLTKLEQKLDIHLKRGEVVLKETRFESRVEPFGDGVIAYLRLYSFYQDPDSSSTVDLTNELEKLRTKYNLKGLILDLRSNAGGMLTQAVGVAGMFISKGTVVSIKDETGKIQHLRQIDGKVLWNGPLIVLTNRASASASEIVAGTLQDYGRAIIVGDDHTYGKGSFQTFTLNSVNNGPVNPKGEYKVTMGRYYTVSGRTPQLDGVQANIVVPGVYSDVDVGEKFTKNALLPDKIKPNFDDQLDDIPAYQREEAKMLYKFNLQKQLDTYTPFMKALRENSAKRIDQNKDYQDFLKEIKQKDDAETVDEEEAEKTGKGDVQLNEAFNIMKDYLYLKEKPPVETPTKEKAA
jgi:carboxyl-terminal processing protease